MIQQGVSLLPILVLESALFSAFQISAASIASSDGLLPWWIQNMNFGMATSSMLFNTLLGFLFLTLAYGLCLLSSLVLDGLISTVASVIRLMGTQPDFPSTELAKRDVIHRPRSTLLSLTLLALVIWLAVPIQFVFLVLFPIQFYSAVISQISAQQYREEDGRTSRANQQKVLLTVYFWLLPFNAPALLIWTRDLTRGYFGVLGGA